MMSNQIPVLLREQHDSLRGHLYPKHHRVPSIFDPRRHIAREEVGKRLTPPAETLAKNVLAKLRRQYPHVADGWRVWVHESGGMVIVKNLMLSGDMGFMQKIEGIDTEYKAIMRAGGELLERYRIVRAAAETLAAEQIATADRDIRGRMRADT